jgi:hypothetical protein
MVKCPPLTIDLVRDSKNELMGFLKMSDPIVLDVSLVGAIDVSGSQLLVALFREAKGTKREIHLAGTLSAPAQEFLASVNGNDSECHSSGELEALLKAVCGYE